MLPQDFDAIAAHRSLGPIQSHESSAEFGINGLALIVSGEFTSIGFFNPLVDVTDVP